MKNKNLAPVLKSNIDQNSSQFQENKEVMLNKLEFLDDLLDQVELGGGKHHHERLAKRGKMPVRERVMKVLDPDTPFLEISPFAAYGTDCTVGGGCVSGVGVIAGVECVVFANDPSVNIEGTIVAACHASIATSIIYQEGVWLENLTVSTTYFHAMMI